MKIKYFSDTYTALIECTVNSVTETKEISENINIDFDTDDHLISMTIKHTKTAAQIKDLTFQEIAATTTA